MTTRKQLVRCTAAFASAALVAGVLGRVSLGQNRPPRPARHHPHHNHPGLSKLKHMVFLVKENRTFDNYFGTFPGADGATSGTIHTGEVIPLSRQPDHLPHDIAHSFDAAVRAIHGGGMDQFDLIDNGCPSYPDDCFAYSQYTEDDIPNYFAIARYFVLADAFFSSLTGPSFPNHLYIDAVS